MNRAVCSNARGNMVEAFFDNQSSEKLCALVVSKKGASSKTPQSMYLRRTKDLKVPRLCGHKV